MFNVMLKRFGIKYNVEKLSALENISLNIIVTFKLITSINSHNYNLKAIFKPENSFEHCRNTTLEISSFPLTPVLPRLTPKNRNQQ